MQLFYKNTDEFKEYDNNPRNNESAVEALVNSIKNFGFKVPIIIDKNNIIIAGHTRLLAAKQLGIETIPCIVADDLNEEQIKAFRLADNKVGELATWDFQALEEELKEIQNIDMSDFEFDDLNREAISYIDDLLVNEFQEHKVDATKFGITFNFDKKYEDQMKNYISENGKETIVDEIIKLITEEQDA